MVLVSPGSADAAVDAANSSNSNAWPRLFDSYIGMVNNEDYEDSDDDEEVEAGEAKYTVGNYWTFNKSISRY